MNAYRAIGTRTDIAKGADDRVTATGETPKDARTRLMQRYMHLVDVHTELIPRAERYAASRKDRAA